MPSPSLSDLGLTPDEEAARERRRQRRHEEYADESGLRPLPRDAVHFEGVDDEVVLPGIRSRARLVGIGAGIGFAVLAVAAGLYFGGYLDRPTLNPPPTPAPLVPNTTFDDAMRTQALEIARFANVKLLSPPVVTPVIRELPLEIEGDVRSPDPISTNPMPAMPEPEGMSTPPRATTPRDTAPTPKDPEMPPPPSGTPPDRQPLPAPAQPTAPAETAPGANPY
jgi:hypothetical protein